MAITTAISDLFKSFYELIASVLSAAYAVVHSTVDAVLGFITGLVTLLGDITGGVIDVTSGVGKFILGMWERTRLLDDHLTGIHFL